MGRYLGRKLSFYLGTFVVAVTVDWAIPRFVPGDPIQGLLSRMQAQPNSQEALTGYYTQAFGLDVPLWKQYLNFWAGLFNGDLGTITPGTPDYDTLVEDRGLGKFDLVLANDRQISNTPWTYYDYIYRLPILDNQTTVNYERFSDPDASSLTKQLDQTPATDVEGMKAVLSQDQGNQVLPAMWRNYLQMTGIDMLTHLQAAR